MYLSNLLLEIYENRTMHINPRKIIHREAKQVFKQNIFRSKRTDTEDRTLSVTPWLGRSKQLCSSLCKKINYKSTTQL